MLILLASGGLLNFLWTNLELFAFMTTWPLIPPAFLSIKEADWLRNPWKMKAGWKQSRLEVSEMDEQDFKVEYEWSRCCAGYQTMLCQFCVNLVFSKVRKKSTFTTFFSSPKSHFSDIGRCDSLEPCKHFCPGALTLTSREMCEPVRQNKYGLTELRQVVRLPRKRTRLF